jgi:hypothetical protein
MFYVSLQHLTFLLATIPLKIVDRFRLLPLNVHCAYSSYNPTFIVRHNLGTLECS